MTALVSYSTGTVSVAAGGTTVTGIGAIWSDENARPGDIFQIGNFQSVISDKTDTTHLVIPPWGGGAQAGVAYKIWQVSPQRFAGSESLATVNKLVAAFNTSGFFVFVDVDLTDPDPSLGDDGQYAFQPTSGKTWAKVSGVWSYLGVYKAFNLRGAYDNAATYSYGDVQTTSGASYIYINEAPSAGHAAPNATYWQLLAAKGDPGAPGGAGATGAGYGGTSATSLAIGTGAKTFATQAGLAYTNGARVRATATAGAAGWVEGVATYSGTALTIASDKTSGGGTGTAWNLNVVGEPGAGDLSSTNALSELSAVAATARGNIGAVGVVKVQKFTASGTYTPSAGMLYCIIECVGGGGGGGGVGAAAGRNDTSGGGGAGGYSRKYATAATIGASKAVTVGGAGAAGVGGLSNGSAGTATSVGTLCIANGGSGGINAAAGVPPNGGLGGAVGTGDIALAGNAGGAGTIGTNTSQIIPSGAGGNSVFGGGGLAVCASGFVNGNAAVGAGGGGSGAGGFNATGTANGGAGANGIVVITEYCTS